MSDDISTKLRERVHRAYGEHNAYHGGQGHSWGCCDVISAALDALIAHTAAQARVEVLDHPTQRICVAMDCQWCDKRTEARDDLAAIEREVRDAEGGAG